MSERLWGRCCSIYTSFKAAVLIFIILEREILIASSDGIELIVKYGAIWR